MIEIAIWGAGGHARVVIDAARESGRFAPVALVDDRDPSARPTSLDGVRVRGGREALGELFERGIRHMIVAFGNCAARLDACSEAEAAGFELVSIIHPRATVARDVLIGAGAFVAAGAVINPGTRVGRGVIVNTSASVDHDCTLGDGAHICPGVVLAGGVAVGDRTWVGVGSVVSNGVAIGSGSIIGAGSLVVRPIGDGVLAYGSPARVVRAVALEDGLVRSS